MSIFTAKNSFLANVAILLLFFAIGALVPVPARILDSIAALPLLCSLAFLVASRSGSVSNLSVWTNSLVAVYALVGAAFVRSGVLKAYAGEVQNILGNFVIGESFVTRGALYLFVTLMQVALIAWLMFKRTSGTSRRTIALLTVFTLAILTLNFFAGVCVGVNLMGFDLNTASKVWAILTTGLGLLFQPALMLFAIGAAKHPNNEPAVDMPIEISPKSRLAATLLCLFFGFFGVHRFYLGKIVTGTLMIALFLLLGFWVGLLGFWVGLWAAIDLIIILIGSFRDGQNRRLFRWTEPGSL